ncbi:MAG: TonB-dependent receptor [Dysgonamonadaceae bacterium]|jgi:outer membrane cobalamin receptor|nr:TonB-dependent receptor [Dysgonamonadaceae bacterium]
MRFCKQTGLRAEKGIVILLSVFLFSMSSFAQFSGSESVATDTVQMFNLDEVVVTASRPRFSVVSPMPAQILSGRDLERLNSFSVADAIRFFSGVQLKDYGGVGGLKTVNVRSLGSAHTAVFYDGMIISNAQNGQVDLGKFSLNNIEAIELYNGQRSSIFQPVRGFFASNTLFLRTKTPQFGNGKSFNINTTFKTGSFGLINPGILYQQKLTENLSLSGNAEWLHAHGRYKFRYHKADGYDTTAVRQNGDITALRTELTLHTQLRNSGQASLKVYFYDSERGLPGTIVANRFHHTQRQWDRNFFVHGTLNNSLFNGHNLLANVKFGSDYTRYLDSDYQMLEGALDNRYYQNEAYFSLVNQVSLSDWWNISLATDFSVQSLDANLYRFPYPTRHSYLGALSTHFSWERLDIQGSLLGGLIDEQVREHRQAESRKVFRPVISASVQPFTDLKSFRVRAFYKESFRMPTFNDLYYTFIGNSFLRPESTTQFNVGATWVHQPQAGFLRSVSVQTDAYYNRVKDKIVAMPSSNLFRWTMMNLGEVEIKGLETNANVGFLLPARIYFDLVLNYTCQKAIDITPGGTTFGDQIPYTPVHSGILTASMHWKSWQLNYSFIYTGERYSQKANIPVNYVQPWYTSDLAVIWERNMLNLPVRMTAEVNNLLNQYYDVILNFPMPGRSYRFGVSVHF